MNPMKKKTRMILATAATALLSVAGLVATQSSAQAATGAYGSSRSCAIGGSTVTIAPHFGIEGSLRNVNGYAFYTSPAHTITYVYEEVKDLGSSWDATYGTKTNPNAGNGVRAYLGSNYPYLPATRAQVRFQVKDAAGNSCWTPTVKV